MLCLNQLVAWMLLSAPSGYIDPAKLPAMYPILRTPLLELATRWQILDPREDRYLLARQEDFAADLDLLRHRRQDLQNAPPVEDALRFPDRVVINELLSFNQAYRQCIDMRQPVERSHGGELRAALQDTNRLYRIWDTLRDARCDYYYVTVRRQALQRLRDLIGPEAYYCGELPPSVPLWQFQAKE